jgi:hypothetical protein
VAGTRGKILGVRSFYTAYHPFQVIKGNKSFPDFNQGSTVSLDRKKEKLAAPKQKQI